MSDSLGVRLLVGVIGLAIALGIGLVIVNHLDAQCKKLYGQSATAWRYQSSCQMPDGTIKGL